MSLNVQKMNFPQNGVAAIYSMEHVAKWIERWTQKVWVWIATAGYV